MYINKYKYKKQQFQNTTHLPNPIFNVIIAIMPMVGLEKIKDKTQVIGIVQKLYAIKIPSTATKSVNLFQFSICAIANIKTIIIPVNKLVNKSKTIDTAQKIGKFTPLAYCKKRAFEAFSYSM